MLSFKLIFALGCVGPPRMTLRPGFHHRVLLKYAEYVEKDELLATQESLNCQAMSSHVKPCQAMSSHSHAFATSAR